MFPHNVIAQSISTTFRLQQEWARVCFGPVVFAHLPPLVKTDPSIGIAVLEDLANKTFTNVKMLEESFQIMLSVDPK